MQVISKELENYNFKILKMEKKNFLLHNYNLSQITNSKLNLENSQIDVVDQQNNNHQNLTKSQINYKTDSEDDQYLLSDNDNEFDQFLNRHKLKYINLPLKL